MPKVSVIIPNYNHARFLVQRIESILNQTYQDFEIIYLDDASTDNSQEVFAPYAMNPRIQSICNVQNSGSPFKQWNRGILQAQGEYIWIAESDDYAAPTFLETLVSLLDHNPSVGVAYCQSHEVNTEGTITGTLHDWTDDLSPHRWRHDFINSGIEECQTYLVLKNTIPNASAVLFRKSVFHTIGYADETMRLCGDWITWIKMLLHSDVAFSAQLLNYYRSHASSVRSTSQVNGNAVLERMQVFALLQDAIALPKPISDQIQRQRMAEWVPLMLTRRNRVSFSQTRKFYTLSKQCGSNVEYHLFHQMCSYVLSKLGA